MFDSSSLNMVAFEERAIWFHEDFEGTAEEALKELCTEFGIPYDWAFQEVCGGRADCMYLLGYLEA